MGSIEGLIQSLFAYHHAGAPHGIRVSTPPLDTPRTLYSHNRIRDDHDQPALFAVQETNDHNADC